jgi:cyanobactin biosynthesis protein (PatB/AcyB/McaB family)
MPHMPIQAPPVTRPELIEPHRAVDVVHGTPDQLVAVRVLLTHGANFNDPAPFALPGYQRLRTSAWRPHA